MGAGMHVYTRPAAKRGQTLDDRCNIFDHLVIGFFDLPIFAPDDTERVARVTYSHGKRDLATHHAPSIELDIATVWNICDRIDAAITPDSFEYPVQGS